jgi:PAS domain S-box-containing protein
MTEWVPSADLDFKDNKRLSIIMKSKFLNFEGSWNFGKAIQAAERLTAPFDYLISINDHNYLIHPEDLSYLTKMIQPSRLNKNVDLRFRVLTPEGGIRELSVQGRLVDPKQNNSDGKAEAGDEANAEHELEHRLFEYSEIVAGSGSWRLNLDSKETIFSDNLYNIFGLTREPIAPSWEQLLGYVHPNDRPKVSELSTVIQRTGEASLTEFRIHRANDQRQRYLKAKTEVFVSQTGTRFCIGTVQDVTAEKLAQKKLDESNAILHQQSSWIRRVVEATPDIIQIVNLESGKAAYVNKMLLEELGYPFEEIKKIEDEKSMLNLVHPDDVKKIDDFRAKFESVSDDEILEVEARVLAKNKSWQWFKTRGKIFERDKNGKPLKYVGFLQNTTGEKVADEERKQHQLLREIDRAKTMFFSNVSHEFRTPLTLMLAPLEDLLGSAQATGGPAQIQKLQMVHRNALRLQKLVNTLLDFSRIEAGRIDAVYQPVDIAKFTTDLASNFRSAIEKAGLKFKVKIQDPGEPVYVNRDMWEKIVLNLLSNAFKFTFEGRIELSLKAKKHHIQLLVTDTGSGISNKNLEKIFERFIRIEGVKSRTHEGTGIGLALVKELVAMHGGSILVQSTDGKGSTFKVSIPRGKAHLPAKNIHETRDNHEPSAISSTYVAEAMGWLPPEEIVLDDRNESKTYLRGNAANETATEKPTVLIAEDNADMLQYLTGLLGDQYDVRCFGNGKKAIEAMQAGLVPDLVVADVMMPDVDGLALMEYIKNNDGKSTVPVILLSARSGEESRIDGMRHGADDYIVKPFSSKELLARIEARILISSIRKKAEQALKLTNKELEERVHQRTIELSESKNLLQKQNERLEKTLEAIPHMVWVADAQGRIRFVNGRWVAYTGLSSEAVENKKFTELDTFDARQVEEIVPTLKFSMDEGVPFHGKITVRNHEGEYRWHLYLSVPIHDKEGGVDCWISSFTDVHEHSVQVDKLKDNKDLLEAVFNSSISGIYVLESVFGENGAITDFKWNLLNNTPEKLHPRDKVSVSGLTKRLPAIADPALIGKLREVVTTGLSIHFEQFVDFSHTGSWFEISAVKLDHKVVLTIHDITKRKVAELELQRMNESLKQNNHQLSLVNDEMSTFAYVASHHLREPLRKIQLFTSMLNEREPEISETGKEYLRKVWSSIQRMNELIEDILNYSRSSAKAREYSRADLNRIVEDSKKDLADLIAEKKAIFECAELPEITCDPFQFRQLFLNLLSNAIKFHKEGVTPVVSVRNGIVDGGETEHPLASPHKKYFLIEVEDNGIGFEKEFESKVFHMFQRLHSNNKYSGTGMGLAICKKVVENHNGFMAVRSVPGSGSVFSCYLPFEMLVDGDAELRDVF